MAVPTTCSALALIVDAGTRGGQVRSIVATLTCHQPGADLGVKPLMVVQPHGTNEDRDERLQLLAAADAVTCRLPQHNQSLPCSFIVQAVPRWSGAASAIHRQVRLSRACGTRWRKPQFIEDAIPINAGCLVVLLIDRPSELLAGGHADLLLYVACSCGTIRRTANYIKQQIDLGSIFS